MFMRNMIIVNTFFFKKKRKKQEILQLLLLFLYNYRKLITNINLFHINNNNKEKN